jgi:DnaJ-class molecular chaperone
MSILLLIAVFAVLGYYLSLRIHPTVRCKRCDTSRRHYDLIYSHNQWQRLNCPSCHGTGRRERLGLRIFGGKSR